MDHEVALREIDRLWGSAPGTADGDRLDVLVTLVEHYEETQWPIPCMKEPSMARAVRFPDGTISYLYERDDEDEDQDVEHVARVRHPSGAVSDFVDGYGYRSAGSMRSNDRAIATLREGMTDAAYRVALEMAGIDPDFEPEIRDATPADHYLYHADPHPEAADDLVTCQTGDYGNVTADGRPYTEVKLRDLDDGDQDTRI